VGITVHGLRLIAWGLRYLILLAAFFITISSNQVLAFDLKDIPAVGAAFLTNLGIHEAGHYIMADEVGAEGNDLNFFKRDKDSFFLGLSTVTHIDQKARPSYHLAGELASSYTFELALKRYREMNTTYNRALLFFSMTDFLWYTTYAFYLSPHEDEKFDPIGISKSTGISRDAIFFVALTQSSFNALRVYTKQDRLIPYFVVDRYFIGFSVKVPF